MLETLQQLIMQYGYIAIVVGCILEGEVCFFLGIFAVQQGLLGYPGVFSATLLGTLISDVGFFYVGRYYGRAAVEKRSQKWRARARLGQRILHRKGWPVLVGFRFAIGLRSISPFIFGAINVGQARFLFFSGLGALLWLIVYGFLGIGLATTIEATLASVEQIERITTATFIGGIIIAGVYYWWYRRKKLRRHR